MTEHQQGPSLGDLITWLGFLTSIVTAWLYVAGWTYAYVYFDRFHLSLGLVEPSTQEILIYGFLTMIGKWWILPGNGVVLVALACCISWRSKLPTTLLMLLTGTLVFAAFYLAHRSGEQVGIASYEEQHALQYPAYPRVSLGLATSTTGQGLLKTLVESGCAKLLITRPNQIVLIRPRRSAPQLPLQSIVASMSSIEWMRISDSTESCE